MIPKIQYQTDSPVHAKLRSNIAPRRETVATPFRMVRLSECMFIPTLIISLQRIFYCGSENRRFVAGHDLEGGTAKAAIDSVTETSDSMTNTTVVFVVLQVSGRRNDCGLGIH